MSDAPEHPSVGEESAALPLPEAGDPLDLSPPPPPDPSRMERAAAMVRPDADEPRTTLHTDQWRVAKARVARLGRREVGRRLAALLEHQERGWAYVRPLAMGVEEADGRTTGRDPASVLYRFIDQEVVDLFRYNAFRCADMVLALGGARPADDVPSTDDVDADTDVFYRAVVVLRMAAAHRLAPPELRVLTDHAAGLDRWYAEFENVFAPAAEAFNRRLRGLGR